MTAGRYLTLAALAATLALTAACGRKAPLDTPYQGALDARKEAMEAREEAERNGQPLPPLPPEPTPPVKDRRFILDGLID